MGQGKLYQEGITVINGIKRCTWAKTPEEFEIVYNDLLHNEASPVHISTLCFRKNSTKPTRENKNGQLPFAAICSLVVTILIIMLNLESG